MSPFDFTFFFCQLINPIMSYFRKRKKTYVIFGQNKKYADSLVRYITVFQVSLLCYTYDVDIHRKRKNR